MKAKDIWLGTMKFNWIKLGVGLGFDLVALILLIVFCAIGAVIGEFIGAYVAFLVWGFTVFKLYHVVSDYVSYMIKSAHIACMAVAVQEGKIPENMVETGAQLVKERFVSSNVYIGVDKLVGGAVGQLQRTVGKIGGFLDFIPGMDNAVEILQKFIGIFLGYVDECCLGYTFVNKDQNAWKSACDGVCIYFQNVKTFLKEAVKITFIVMVFTTVVAIIAMLLMLGLVGIFNVPSLGAVVLGIMVALTLKEAFVDSYIMCQMLTVFLQVAPQTELSVDVYGKLCGLSSKFKEMWQNAGLQNQDVA
ncbi:MAG: hypothetical protein IJN64_20055 [Lachnospiraceae bacterium]|nr:hypothetical protein [Lachnospiraceae bacterium]MBQ6996740.1 hypothetical protein [Lachnospiraceae bacterium]